MAFLFLIPLLIGLAVVTDFRGVGSHFAGNLPRGKDGRLPGVVYLTGGVFIALPGFALVSMLVRFIVSLG
ncbi:hypothetical protein ACWEQL_03805 [Kitasatospora sp. NPDC004240]